MSFFLLPGITINGKRGILIGIFSLIVILTTFLNRKVFTFHKWYEQHSLLSHFMKALGMVFSFIFAFIEEIKIKKYERQRPGGKFPLNTGFILDIFPRRLRNKKISLIIIIILSFFIYIYHLLSSLLITMNYNFYINFYFIEIIIVMLVLFPLLKKRLYLHSKFSLFIIIGLSLIINILFLVKYRNLLRFNALGIILMISVNVLEPFLFLWTLKLIIRKFVSQYKLLYTYALFLIIFLVITMLTSNFIKCSNFLCNVADSEGHKYFFNFRAVFSNFGKIGYKLYQQILISLYAVISNLFIYSLQLSIICCNSADMILFTLGLIRIIDYIFLLFEKQLETPIKIVAIVFSILMLFFLCVHSEILEINICNLNYNSFSRINKRIILDEKEDEKDVDFRESDEIEEEEDLSKEED